MDIHWFGIYWFGIYSILLKLHKAEIIEDHKYSLLGIVAQDQVDILISL